MNEKVRSSLLTTINEYTWMLQLVPSSVAFDIMTVSVGEKYLRQLRLYGPKTFIEGARN